jgi:hypothetical protein
MRTDLARHPKLEAHLARLLDAGTWMGCLVIAIGILVSLTGAAPAELSGSQIVASGVAVFIALPIFRVLLMAAVFLADADYLFGAIATSVLLIIALGAAVALKYANAVL